jgi:basic membrane protein A
MRAILICAMAALVAGCNSPTGSKTEQPGGGSGLQVAIVFDKGGVGDKSFNDSADRGRARAETELGIKSKTVASRSSADYKTNLEELARAGYKLIFAIGGDMQTSLEEVAPKYPDTKFAIIDGESKGNKNVIGVRFKEEEGSFLCGVVAGLMTKSNKVGFVGGRKIPLIEKFEYGFRAGVYAVNPKAEVVAKYTEDWDNVAKGKDAALACHEGGADVVYHAAGRCGLGVIDAAADKGFYAIGVDSDQDGVKPGVVLTSMVKGVDEQIFRLTKLASEDKLPSGDIQVGLKEGGVGLTEMKYTKDKIGASNLAKIEGYKKQIISGSLSVPKTAEEFENFKHK